MSTWHPHRPKGQVVSSDFVFSVIVFSFALFLVYSSWNLLVEKTVQESQYSFIFDKGYYVSDLLVRSRGIPEDWDSLISGSCKSVRLVGLKESDDLLNATRIQAINDNMACVKSLWGLEGYGVNITLEGLYSRYTAGEPIDPGARILVPIHRMVIYRNTTGGVENGRLTLYIWT